jgi:MFS family permease
MTSPAQPHASRPEPSRLYRWIVLLFVSMAMGSAHYIYDSINPLQRVFAQRLGFTATTFGWMNSAYSLTAILTLLAGGYIIDRLGTRKAITGFALICLLGALLTAAQGRPGMMIAGRAVLGLGGESIIVAATTALAKWFKGKELSFAFGIKITISRMASVAADNSPTWAHKVFYPNGAEGDPSWRGPLLLSVGAGVLAVLCSAIYWALENRAQAQYEPSKSATREKPDFAQLLRFNPSYWFVVGLCFTFYTAIFPFRTFAIGFFTNKILASNGGVNATEAMRILAHQRAGFYNSLLPLSAMIATPLIGLLSDRIGKRAFFMMFASFLLMPVYLIMGYTNISLLVPLCMMGVAFSTIPAVMWPSVAYIVDGKRLGTAYALMTLLEQIGFFVLNLLIGKANDSAHAGLTNLAGYRPGLLVFSLLGFVGLTFSILLRIRETGPHGHGLETITSRGKGSGMAPAIESGATV